MILNEKQRKSSVQEKISAHLPQQLKVIERLTHLLNQPLTNLSGLLQLMAWEVCDAIDSVQFCIILLWNSQAKQLEVTATSGIDPEKLPHSKLTDTQIGLLGQVFVTGSSRLFYRKTKADLPSSLYAYVIESSDSGKLGVLGVGNWDSPHAFNVIQQNLLNVVGEVTAIAINNARTIQALAETEQQLARQNEILKAKNCELDKTRQQNQVQNLQLLEAAQLKSQFLATTSHELRTPLNVILGLSQVLLRQRTSTLCEQQVEMVQRILNNGNHLLATINDLLDFAKLETGCLSFHVEEFNLTTLVLKTIAEHFSLAEQKRLNLSFHVNLDNPLIVNDSVSLKQVLVKLLLNAIKFTETGCIEVKVWELCSDRIAIAIIDTGIGIAESHVDRIFDQFWQVDQTTTRNYGGTGLGLAITKSLVEIMQGIISVKSKLGQGSTFQIELPRTVRNC
ncbi:MAG: hybrid sensor histidine kinase/response regulator [Stigonema ocellatum SAG 48.90 = DSM 106950]|nr:hybrid sensor histidine kinase/response regulator [Stigonema ocellatum SAG 48.90 = DSM 106950]